MVQVKTGRRKILYRENSQDDMHDKSSINRFRMIVHFIPQCLHGNSSYFSEKKNDNLTCLHTQESNVEILKAIAADFSASSIWYSSYLPATKLRNLFVLMTVGVHVAASTCSRCLAKMAASSLSGMFIVYGTELMLLKHFHVYKILHQIIIFLPIWFRF